MKLKISRSQKEKGIMSKSITFCLDARVELTPEEADAVRKYHLDKQVIYNSAKTKDWLSKADDSAASGSLFGSMKGLALIAVSKLSLHITIESLTQGHHIECDSMDELLGAEGAIHSACEHMKVYLEKASTFDGQEHIIEI